MTTRETGTILSNGTCSKTGAQCGIPYSWIPGYPCRCDDCISMCTTCGGSGSVLADSDRRDGFAVIVPCPLCTTVAA
jgi:hypothetical protein